MSKMEEDGVSELSGTQYVIDHLAQRIKTNPPLGPLVRHF